MVVHHWFAGDGPPQSGFTSPYQTSDWWGIMNIPEGHTIERVWVETALYTRTVMADSISTPFDPTWYADNGNFILALAYYEGGGLPGAPNIPDPGAGGDGQFLWRAVMKPRCDMIWDPVGQQSQVVRWEPEAGTQMQSKGKRGPVPDLGTYLYWSWFTIDINGYFGVTDANMFSYMAGDIYVHVLTSTLT